jgi:hypothetical protein
MYRCICEACRGAGGGIAEQRGAVVTCSDRGRGGVCWEGAVRHAQCCGRVDWSIGSNEDLGESYRNLPFGVIDEQWRGGCGHEGRGRRHCRRWVDRLRGGTQVVCGIYDVDGLAPCLDVDGEEGNGCKAGSLHCGNGLILGNGKFCR